MSAPTVDFHTQLAFPLGADRTPQRYTFLYWSDVARPVDQINRNVNSTLVPTSIVAPSGPPTPPLIIKDTSFWAHGVNFGLEFRF